MSSCYPETLTQVRENGAVSGVGVLATYGYDDLGRRRSLTRGNGAVTSYGYDGASRLTSLVHDLAGTSHDQSYGFALQVWCSHFSKSISSPTVDISRNGRLIAKVRITP